MTKLAYCEYATEDLKDSGTEALRVLLPAAQGYILHYLVHSVKESNGCDVWRLGPAYHVPDDVADEILLTTPRAEWEMAIRLKDRPDFIGGVIHGDERMTRAVFRMDGREFTPSMLSKCTAFTTLEVEVDSTGFDPLHPETSVLLHHKVLTFTSEGVTVRQRVEWLGDYALGNSYMAMMPPRKEWTNSYKADTGLALNSIKEEHISATKKTEELYLCGDDYGFSMRVPRYLSHAEGNKYLITDNGGGSYNKMYFVLAHGGHAHMGDVWETETNYRIDILTKGAKNG
jgi:hypothetical protein